MFKKRENHLTALFTAYYEDIAVKIFIVKPNFDNFFSIFYNQRIFQPKTCEKEHLNRHKALILQDLGITELI